MIKNWLHDCNFLVSEKDEMLNLSYNGKTFQIEKSRVENADIHESIDYFDKIYNHLVLGKDIQGIM